jgi:hypothetical protein
MLPAISVRLAFFVAVNVQGTHRIWWHFIPKDSVRCFRTVVELMFKAFAIFSLKDEDPLLAPLQHSHAVPHQASFPVAGRLNDPLSRINFLDSVVHLGSLNGIQTKIFIPPVNDFRPLRAFLHEELDTASLLHIYEKRHFRSMPG